MDEFELGAFRLPASEPTVLAATKSPPKSKRKRKLFLKGPIPWSWIQRAAGLRGKAPLAVALVIWHLSGLKGTREELPVCGKHIEKLGLKRRTAYDAIAKLESVGLVSVERKPGACPRVTILMNESEFV